jgi:hypothetical protein
VPHPVIYTITEIGNLLAVCGPALCMGVAALILALRAPLPKWSRAVLLVGGISGVLAPLFFTYIGFVLCMIVSGATAALRRSPTSSALRPATAALV